MFSARCTAMRLSVTVTGALGAISVVPDRSGVVVSAAWERIVGEWLW